MAPGGYALLFYIHHKVTESSQWLPTEPSSINQPTGESQTECTSESYEEIIQHWEEEKYEQDKLSKLDMELAL